MPDVFKLQGPTGSNVFSVDDSGNVTAAGTLSSTGVDDFGTGGIKADVVAESSPAAGVTVDGMLIKDGGAAVAYLLAAPGGSTAAAGTTAANATALPAGTSLVYPTTVADGTKGVIINAADKVTGRMIFIGNGVAAAVLKIYPPTGGTINGGAADAEFSTASGKGAILYCLSGSGNTWLAW